MNTNFHYKFIKLVNGEDIICSTDDDLSKLKKSGIVHVVDPVIVRSMRYPRGMTIVEGYVLQHWVSYASQSVFEIPVGSIVTVADLDEKMKDTYKNFISEETQKMRTPDPADNIMSQLENEKLASILEELSTSIKEDNNAEEETIKPPRGRTLH